MIEGEIRVKKAPPCLCFVPQSHLLSLSPAVGKVSEPRRGHLLVESVIVDTVGYVLIVRGLLKLVACRTRAYPCMHMTH